jgi:hypothetical protein
VSSENTLKIIFDHTNGVGDFHIFVVERVEQAQTEDGSLLRWTHYIPQSLSDESFLLVTGECA